MIRPPGLASVCRRLPSRSRLRPPHACLSLRVRREPDRGGPVFDMPPPPSPSSSGPSSSSSSALGTSVHPFADADPAREPPRIEPEPPEGGTDIGRDHIASPSGDQPLPSDSTGTEKPRSRRTGPSSAPFEGELLDASATAVARVPLPEPLVVTPKRVRQPFDTHLFVTRLNEATIEPDASKALMESVRHLITQRVDRASSNMLSKEELDNEAYLFKAALSKLRTEWNVRNRNAGIAGRNALSAIRRDLDGVELKMSEDVQTLKHEIELDMGNRKTDTRSDMKQVSIDIEEINNRATISIGDLKTEIESAKWEATRRAIAIIAVMVVFGVGMSTVSFGADAPKPPKPVPIDPGAHPASWNPPATRDIGIGTDDEFDYEAKIDKLLSSVERPERKDRPERKERPRRNSKPEPFVDRI